MKPFSSRLLATLSATVIALTGLTPATQATEAVFGVSYYISPPMVQGSYVTGTGTHLETFNNPQPVVAGSCNIVSGSMTFTGCKIDTAKDYGGATTAVSTPTAGGTGTQFASTSSGSVNTLVSFSEPMKYLGFWWSAGSLGNKVTFKSGVNTILQLTTDDLFNVLGAAPSDALDATDFRTTGKITAINTAEYFRHDYFGNPRGYADTNPTVASTVGTTEPFVYIHVFVSGDTTFNSVELSGAGFEFDNFVVSSEPQTPSTDLVPMGTILPKVTFNANGGTGTMAPQASGSAAALNANTFERSNFIFGGWSTLQGGGETTYSDGASFPFSSSQTLYAQWVPVQTVTFDANEGDGTMPNQVSQTAAVLSQNSFTRDGFTFGGWNTEPDGTGDAYQDLESFPFEANDTLYAQWIAPPVQYTGPVLESFSTRNLDTCKPTSVTINGIRLAGAVPSVQGKTLKVLESTDRKLVIEIPAGLTPGSNVSLELKSSQGTMTHQGAFNIRAADCAPLSKGKWTNLLTDGKTVRIIAKDPVADGKVQFFVDGKELAWVTALDETDPKLSFANGSPYLVRSVELKPGKNRFEIKVDGKRVWRATYVPLG